MSQINVWLRKKQKLILAFLCCALMVVFIGGGALFSALARQSPIGGRIFNRAVSGDELEAQARGIYLLSGGRLGGDLAFAKAWELLLLNEEAQRFGINVGDGEIRDRLKDRFPNQAGDGLSQADYHDFLAKQHATPLTYEEALKTVLTANQLQECILRNVNLPKEEAWLWYSRENRKIKVTYLMLRAEDLAPLIQLQAGEIKDYYQKHTEPRDPAAPPAPSYRDPEQIQIEYVLARSEKYAKDIKITSQQIQDHYDQHKKDYLLPEPATNDKDKPQTESGAAEEKKPAPQYKPLDQVRNEIEKNLRGQAAEREADKIIKQVNEEIYRIIEARPEESIAAPVDMKALAERFQLQYRRTRYFGVEEVNTILPGAFALASQAFGKGLRELGYPKPPMKADDGFFIYQTLNTRPPQPSPFENVKDQVEKDLRLGHALRLADDLAVKAANAPDLQQAEKSIREQIAALVKESGLPPETDKDKKTWFARGESKFFTRPRLQRSYFQDSPPTLVQYETGLPGYGNHARFAAAAFSTAPGKVGHVTEYNAAILFQHSGAEAAKREEFDKNTELITYELLEKKRAAVIADWRRDLIRRALPSSSALQHLAMLPDWRLALANISEQ